MNPASNTSNPTALNNGDATNSAADSKLTGAATPAAPVRAAHYRLALVTWQLHCDAQELERYESLDLELLARIVGNVRVLNARVQELHNRALGFETPKVSR